jgi:ABC-2 type transport system permease protein
MSINWFGALSLFKKEVWRFLKVYHQTLLSPVVGSMLLLAVFSLSVGHQVQNIGNIEFVVFMSSGLVMMTAMQNAFANSSSSLVMGKVMGNIIDFLIPPLGPLELLLALSFAAVIRGVLVGLITYFAISSFIHLTIYNLFYSLFMLFMGCMFLGMLGILCGILSDSFDQMSAVTSYFITPLTFLSGTFYSTSSLPGFWYKIAHFNPFFYIIDGFRYGITGYHDGILLVGVFYLIAINLTLFLLIYYLFKIGYNSKH